MAKCEMVINQNYDDLLENWKRYYEKSKEVWKEFKRSKELRENKENQR